MVVTLVAALIALVVGALVGWLVGSQRASALEAQLKERDRAVQAREAEYVALQTHASGLQTALNQSERDAATLEARLQSAEQAHADQLKLLNEAQQRLSESFQALAARALASNNEQFLKLAKTSFEATQQAATSELDKRRLAVEALVKPIAESLEKVNLRIGEVEKERVGAYSALTEQVKSLGQTQTQLQSETAQLVRALRAPQTRGRWGETTLRRVVEMAGMMEHCDFNEQVSVDSDAGRLRPDMVVHLPGGLSIVVDAKVSLQAYLDSLEATDDATRAAFLQQHAQQVKAHLTRLGSKSYFAQFDSTPDFVVAFIPGDTFLGAAFEKDPTLLEYGIANHVLVTTPATLIALLKTVAYAWRQEALAENARHIVDLGKEIYERIAVMATHFAGVGKAIGKAVDSYNDAVGSMERNVLSSARRFRDLQVESTKEAPEVTPLDHTVRTLQAPELTREAGGE